jgi:hypothetical protein
VLAHFLFNAQLVMHPLISWLVPVLRPWTLVEQFMSHVGANRTISNVRSSVAIGVKPDVAKTAQWSRLTLFGSRSTDFAVMHSAACAR